MNFEVISNNYKFIYAKKMNKQKLDVKRICNYRKNQRIYNKKLISSYNNIKICKHNYL